MFAKLNIAGILLIFMLLSIGSLLAGVPSKFNDLLDAIKNSNIEKVRILIQEDNSLINYAGGYNTPLGYAVSCNEKEIVKLLIDNGADINIQQGLIKITALHNAAVTGNIEITKLLISNGAEVNAKSKDDYTPLHYAALNGNIEIAKLLISSGANFNAKSKNGETPLKTAAKNGKYEIMELLFECNAEGWKEYGSEIMRKAIYNGKPEIVIKFLEKDQSLVKGGYRYDYGETPLHYAVTNKQTEIVKILIQYGADMNAKTWGSGRGPAEVTPLHDAVLTGVREILEILLTSGADVNVKDSNGETPLDYAKKYGSPKIVELLHKYGAKE